MKRRKNKEKYIDDGHTIYNMNVEGMPHYIPKNDSQIYLSKKEKRAVIKAAFKYYMPILFGIIICFLLGMLLIYIWLK
jgi:hypothetical protein